MVSLRREVQNNTVHIQSFGIAVQGLKNDIHTLAIAIDSHGGRLAAMDQRLVEFEGYLSRIEQCLDRPELTR